MRDRILEHGPKIRRIVLIATLTLVILIFVRGIRDPFNIPKVAVLFTGTAIAAALRAIELLQGAERRYLDRFAIPAATISIPLFISWVFSDQRGTGVMGEYGRWQGLVPYLVTILFAALIADAFEGRLSTLAWGFASAAAFVGGYSVMQGLGLDPFLWSLGSGQTFQGLSSVGNPNFTGGILGIALPIVIGLWLTQRKRFPKVVPWCGVVIVAGWLYAQSQGGWAAGIGGAAVTAGLLFGDRIPFGRIAGWLIAGGVLAASVGAAAIGNAMNLGFVPLTARLRGEWWVMAANMGLESPLVGHGPDTFATTGMGFRTLKEGLMDRGVLPDTPHSVFMWFFACAGILGALGFLALIVWVVSRSREIGEGNVWGAAFIGASVAYFIQAFVSIDQLPVRVAGWATFAGLAAALVPIPERVGAKTAARPKKNKKKQPRKGTPLRWAPALIPLVAVPLVVAWWSANFVLADYRMRVGSSSFAKGEYSEGIQSMERAIGFREELQYRGQFGLLLGDAGKATSDVSYFQRAEELFAYVDESNDIRGPTNRAHVYEQWMDLDASKADLALADYRRAYELDPYNPQSVTNLSDFLVRIQRPEEALEVIEPFVAIVQDPPPGVEGQFGDVFGAWAMALAADGQIQQAEEALATTRSIAPEDRHISFTEQILEIKKQGS